MKDRLVMTSTVLPTSAPHLTMSASRELGRMCLNSSRRRLIPSTRAPATYGMARVWRISPRSIRAVTGHAVIISAMIADFRPTPRAAVKPRAKMMVGTAMIASVSRISASSTSLPPRVAMAAITAPISE
jgi:hypothetical protein